MSRRVLDADRVRLQLAEIHRDRLGRFSDIDFLRTCDPVAGCGADSDLDAAVSGMDAFLETLELMVATTDPDEVRELGGIVREYRRTLRSDLEELDKLEADSDGDARVLRREPPAPPPLWVSGLGVGEHMDVTGLNGKEAATLALVLNTWTSKGRKRTRPTYKWRNGKRYMAGPSRHTVDLNHPIMAPFRDDLLAAMKDPDSAREFELDESALLAADVGAIMEAGYEDRAEAEALERRRPPSILPTSRPRAGTVDALRDSFDAGMASSEKERRRLEAAREAFDAAMMRSTQGRHLVPSDYHRDPKTYKDAAVKKAATAWRAANDALVVAMDAATEAKPARPAPSSRRTAPTADDLLERYLGTIPNDYKRNQARGALRHSMVMHGRDQPRAEAIRAALLLDPTSRVDRDADRRPVALTTSSWDGSRKRARWARSELGGHGLNFAGWAELELARSRPAA